MIQLLKERHAGCRESAYSFNKGNAVLRAILSNIHSGLMTLTPCLIWARTRGSINESAHPLTRFPTKGRMLTLLVGRDNNRR